jgi:hypothetical protein
MNELQGNTGISRKAPVRNYFFQKVGAVIFDRTHQQSYTVQAKTIIFQYHCNYSLINGPGVILSHEKDQDVTNILVFLCIYKCAGCRFEGWENHGALRDDFRN